MYVNRFRFVVLAAAVALPAAALAGTITGTVKYDGKVPNLRPIQMNADPECAKKHDEAVPNPVLVLGEENTMANIFVKVASGLPDEKWPEPSEPAVMDQKGCMYDPHIQGVRVGQKFKILNSDELMHNVHALPDENEEFNMAMPPTVTESVKTFTKAEGMFRIKCDVHPWMTAYVAVMPHPFFDTTEKDGKFEITGLPAGTYEIQAWHEKLGTRTEKVTVGEDETKTVDFSLAPPKR